MSLPDLDAVVVGAGAAGLAAACELRRRGQTVAVLDAGERPGGVMGTEAAGGYHFETGPNTVLVKAPMLGFLRSHGLEDVLQAAGPASRLRQIYHRGALVPVPMGPAQLVRTPLLSGRGKLRLLAEPFLPRGDGGAESVAEFFSRRLGREIVEGLVGPFLVGVYAGDENELGAEAVFPSLVELERSHGSIVRGGLARIFRRGERGLPGSHSAHEGLGTLAAAMAGRLGEALALGSRVRELAPDRGGFRLEVEAGEGGRSLRARRLVLATPAREAAELLRPLDDVLAKALDSIPYAPVASVSVGVDPSRTREPVEGFGFLVPRPAGLDLLGCLFMSRIFPGRAPEGRALLACMLGGAGRPELVDLPEDRLRQRLQADLERTLGLGEPAEILGVRRWPRAVPQPGRNHPRLVREIRSRLVPGLVLAGAYLDGVSVSDTIASGVRAAEQLAGSDAD